MQGNGHKLTVKSDGAINANVTLDNTALTVDDNEGAASFLSSTGALTVQSDSTLTMLSTEMIGDNGNLKLSDGGAVTLQMAGGKLNVTINGEVESPKEKQWTTRMTTGVNEDNACLLYTSDPACGPRPPPRA